MANMSEGQIEPLIRQALDGCDGGVTYVRALKAKVEHLATLEGLGQNVKAQVFYELRARLAGINGYRGWQRVGEFYIDRTNRAVFYARTSLLDAAGGGPAEALGEGPPAGTKTWSLHDAAAYLAGLSTSERKGLT
jgi:hypothetical protein